MNANHNTDSEKTTMPKPFIYLAILLTLSLVGCKRDNKAKATQNSNKVSEKSATPTNPPLFQCNFVFEPLPGFDRPVARVICDPAFPPVSEIIFFTADTLSTPYEGNKGSYFPTSTEVFDDFRIEQGHTYPSISLRYLKLESLDFDNTSNPLNKPLNQPASLTPPDPAQVPTPALLTGLVSISVAAMRKRAKSAADDSTFET
ncbi:MAG: PTPA-CTERM sorting domain-containing protein [Leptolyngbyaceae cyanobacterium SM2_5_2]|nr:PTPA-CTERM sorting domain-containing protein [Leptolyngbyaceae cyanobacterium SM2_5_2]